MNVILHQLLYMTSLSDFTNVDIDNILITNT